MIEPFCSVYTKYYRPHNREPDIERAKPCLYYNELLENFLPAEDSKEIYNPERDETVIKDYYLKRLKTIYQVSYCSYDKKKSMIIDPNNLEEDQFMVHFNKCYGKRTEPVPRPLDTARTVNGYTRFSYYYTGKSEYEETIGREAYNYFKRDYDVGKSRLYSKKQLAMKPDLDIEWKEKKEKNPQDLEIKKCLEEMKRKEIKRDDATEICNKTKEKEIKDEICAVCCGKFKEIQCPTNKKV